MKLSKKDIGHLEEILDYLGDEEFKHFANMVEDKDEEDKEAISDHIWLHVRAMYIALGYEEFRGISLDALDGSVSVWDLDADAYKARHPKHISPSTI